MNIEDIKIGQRVQLHMDKSRFNDLDWAFLTRQSEQGKKNGPSPEGRVFWVGEFFEATLPEPHTMITLYQNKDGYKVYLAESRELTLVEDIT